MGPLLPALAFLSIGLNALSMWRAAKAFAGFHAHGTTLRAVVEFDRRAAMAAVNLWSLAVSAVLICALIVWLVAGTRTGPVSGVMLLAASLQGAGAAYLSTAMRHIARRDGLIE